MVSYVTLGERRAARYGSPLFVVLTLGALLACKWVPEPDENERKAAAAGSAGTATAPAQGDANPQNPVQTASGVKPLPIAVGQWARYKSTQGGGTTLTYRVTGEESGAHWIDISTQGSSGEATVSMLMSFELGRDYDSLNVKRAKVKLPDGKEHQVSGVLLKPVLQGLRGQLGALGYVSFEKMEKEDVTVPAGRFPGSYYRDLDVKVYGIASKGRAWHHSSVPIAALVKTETVTQGERVVIELEAYGLTSP
ncbi:MAG: hypothetical protein KIT72_17060 [Polyangiaceae bacterium]|nr:hypothetical protein [Polyangiaceae bacterium]MCW5792129.1 hypothetical protein [Polyangiaceae bacterium]